MPANSSAAEQVAFAKRGEIHLTAITAAADIPVPAKFFAAVLFRHIDHSR